MQLCGVDYGLKRVGLALGDSVTGVVSPLVTLQVRGGLDVQVRAIQQAVDDYDVGAWVVGLPLNMDGTEGGQAKTCRSFADRLATLTGQPVHLFDERLSSREAGDLLVEVRGRATSRRPPSDHLAAMVILKAYLEARSGPSGET